MAKPKIFRYSIILIFIIAIILVILFGGYFQGIIGNIISYSKFSRPAQLLDVSMSLEYAEIEAGETQIISTKIINMGAEEAEDVVVRYTIWNEGRDRKISEYTETTAIQTSISLIRKIYIPEDLPGGTYITEVHVESGSSKINASSSFIVKSTSKKIEISEYILIALLITLVVILFLIYYLIRIISKSRIIEKRSKK